MKIILGTYLVVFFALIALGYFKAAAILAAVAIGLAAWILFRLSAEAAAEEQSLEGDKPISTPRR